MVMTHPKAEQACTVPAVSPHLSATENRLGAFRSPDGDCSFTVWAPRAKRVEVILPNGNRAVELAPQARGYHSLIVPRVAAGSDYVYRLDAGAARADPASRYQPDGVFGSSRVVDVWNFEWSDHAWPGLPLREYILYELHVGTYTPAGTLSSINAQLADLKALGVTAIELMPVAQFPGTRNWGYDGVFPFAVQNTYGGPHSLQGLVNTCHQEGIAVVLDVVYNHLGPEGNYLSEFGPYFTDRYHTPWGEALNFDGPQSDEVIRYFVENALSWLEDFHIDALRLDAIHGIFDRSAQPFLAMLSSAVDNLSGQIGRPLHLIAESDLNDARFVGARNQGGFGLHAQWNDDFHHSLHSLQTGEHAGYYCDFGSIRQLEKALQHGFVFTGEYSEFRQRRHGSSSNSILRSQLVVYSQNHDQVGNRMLGERSSVLLGMEAQKLSAAMVMLSPNLPLLFMGEEYGEIAPFLYFTSHQDPHLAEAVRNGRRAEFAAFQGHALPPDPQAESTFLASRLDHPLRRERKHRVLWEFYRELIRLRKTLAALRESDASSLDVTCCDPPNCLRVRRTYEQEEIVMLFNFGHRSADCGSDIPSDTWTRLLDSSDTLWMGPGSEIPKLLSARDRLKVNLRPQSCCVLERSRGGDFDFHREPLDQAPEAEP